MTAYYKTDLFTGLRHGEILGLTRDCVNFDTGTLTINKQLVKEHKQGGQYLLAGCKTDRIRRVKPAAFVMDLLKQRRAKQLEDRLLAGSIWQND